MKIICPYCKWDFLYNPDSKRGPNPNSEIVYCDNCDQRMIVDTKWKLELQVTRIEHNYKGKLHEDRSI